MPELKLINSRFTKISGTREISYTGDVSTKTNIKIIEVEIIKDSKTVVQIKYNFEINYSGLGQVYLEGIIYISADPKIIKDIQKSWADKKIETQNYALITNIIIQKASLKAFEIEDELGLPIHIKLPKVEIKKESN
jgi:hypothetical protein